MITAETFAVHSKTSNVRSRVVSDGGFRAHVPARKRKGVGHAALSLGHGSW